MFKKSITTFRIIKKFHYLVSFKIEVILTMSELSFSARGTKRSEETLIDRAAMSLACHAMPRNFWSLEARDIHSLKIYYIIYHK